MTTLAQTGVAEPEPRVRARRAIEALRSGVPSRDAVAALGSGQGEAEDRFTALLGRVGEGGDSGLLLGGGFGSGKSHLLEHLGHLALAAGFAVSRVVVSKETPLYDPVKVFRAAVGSLVLPGAAGQGLEEVVAGLDVDGPAYADLLRWAASAGSGLDERFAATLTLFRRAQQGDGEFAQAIVRFWCGDPIPVPELRRRLREAGEGKPELRPVGVKDLARQRLRFLARLLRAAGLGGWVLLFDEVELIGRYTVLQRARSYAELPGWLRGDPDDPHGPRVAVLAMTDDFDAAVLTEKGDRAAVPTRLRAKETPEFDEMAGLAEKGMRLIERSMVLLTPPDDDELDRAVAALRTLHGEAFGWDPPEASGLERLGATRMRQYVRAWINEWDLVRLDPSFTPETEVLTVPADYREDPDLEGDRGP
jgi:P-loop Domain of unknown function (DUF2791)